MWYLHKTTITNHSTTVLRVCLPACVRACRSDTESHTDVNKSEGKRKYVVQLNNLFRKRSNKPEAPAANDDVEEGKTSQDEDDNAPPSESTVIVEDEPQKKVRGAL